MYIFNFFLKVLTSIFKCEIIFFFILREFFVDLSIIAAKPTRFAFAFLINFTHSILDFPVVITSSTIKTLDLFLILKDNDWLKKYIFWELDLLKILGYDLELENFVEKDIVENKTIYYASSSNEKKYVPNFLIEKELEVEDLKTLLSGLKLVGDYLDKTILKPNNLNYPNSRLLFINSLK